MNFKVELPDGSWQATDDLTGAELEAIEKATGTPWSLINPLRRLGDYRSIVAAFVMRGDDMTDDELVAWFNARSTTQLAAGLVEVAADATLPGTFEDGLPLEEGGRSTSTSASSHDRPSTGPHT